MKNRYKLLYISTFFPYPAHSGGRLRIANILPRLKDFFDINLVTLNLTNIDQSSTEKALDHCESVQTVRHVPKKVRAVSQGILTGIPYEVVLYSNKSLKNKVNLLYEEIRPDVIWVSRMAAAQYIPTQSSCIHILDQHDLSSHLWDIRFKNAKSVFVKGHALINRLLVEKYEKTIYPRFNVIISVSKIERNLTRKFTSEDQLLLVAENGFDNDYYRPISGVPTGKTAVMVGSMYQRRNVDAALFFAKEIFPAVKRVIPEFKFVIVGKDPIREIKALSKVDGIIVTGTVPDIRPFIQSASVIVLPYRMGSGVKHKLPIAMAMEKAIVTTDNGRQGIAIEHDVHALIANKADEFIDAIIKVMNNPELASRIGKNARILALEHYTWDGIVTKLATDLLDRIN